MLPNFLIIGAEKTATTFIQNCLEEHPDIFMPSGEISYFEDPDFKQVGLKEFEKIFSDVKREKAVGIKRPNYLSKVEVPVRIRKTLPQAKLIVILRNPIERAISAYFHNIKYGFIPCIPAEKGMVNLLEGEYEKKYPRSHEIIEFSFYYKYLNNYFAIFNKEQIFITFHEEIVKDKLAVIKNMYSFLEVDTSFIPQRIDSKPQAVNYSIPRLRFLRLRNNSIYIYSSDGTRLFMKPQKLVDKLISNIIGMIDRYILALFFSEKTKPILSISLNKRLFRVYKSDIEGLENLLNINLCQWKIKH